MKLSKREIKNLIVNIPPRHGKSELISKYFPVWYLALNPDERVILTTYQNKFASYWGIRIKEVIEENSEKIDLIISKSARSSNYFELKGYKGSVTCVGVGGSITGKGGNLIIVDDPIKNDQEANSFLKREKLWDWFKATLYTRLEPNGVMVLVMTRWHEDDLCGRLLNMYFKNYDLKNCQIKIKEATCNCKWCLLSLPALASENDILGRKKGEPLWLERFSKDDLFEIKNVLGDYWFSALYQQNPVSNAGRLFNRKLFRYFVIKSGKYLLLDSKETSNVHKSISIDNCSNFAVMDLATSLSEGADYTVALVFALSSDTDILVLDVIREHIEGAGHLSLIEKICLKYHPLLVGIENTQYQSTLIQMASRKGLPVKSIRADKDKLSRALPILAKMEQGQVYFKADASWLLEFEDELLKFPNSRYDDQVDAFAYISYIINPITNLKPIGKQIRFSDYF